MTNTNYYIYSVFELLYLDNNTIMCNVCEPAVYLYTNARGRVIYVSVLFHATLCMIFVANLKYI
jgi:hypothetical protein